MKTLLIHITSNVKLNDLLKDIKFINNKSINLRYIAHKNCLKATELKKFINKIHYKYDDVLDIKSTKSKLSKDLDKIRVYQYLDMMLSDPKTMSIFERTYFFKTYNTRRIRIISILFFKTVNFLKGINPRAYVLGSTPHGITEYLFKWACLALDIDVVYMQESLFQWRYYTIIEKNTNRYLLTKGQKWNSQDQIILNDLKNKLKNENYLAPYEVERKINSKKHFSLINEIKLHWRRPDLIINKYIVDKFYKKISSNFKLPKSGYIFFPLQFTPERTTLPEGGRYFEQFRAIHEIRSKFGKNIKIIVKEHPATFSYICHWKERNKNFYKAIKNIGNISYAPVYFPTVKLIKNSTLSISINSSICLEALLLNKCSIFMSSHKFFEIESSNLYKFENLNKKKINYISHKSKKQNIFNKDWFERYTFKSNTVNSEFLSSDTSMQSYRFRSYNEMILKLIKCYSKNNVIKYFEKINDIKKNNMKII